MQDAITFRPARKEDSRIIAEMFRISSGGVADYIWRKMASDYPPGLSLVEIGARRYARENTDFSYQNCVLAECRGAVVGMMHCYPIAQDAAGESEEVDPVLRPYAELEVPGSLYLSSGSVLSGYRDQGIGSLFLTIARHRARRLGLDRLSVIVFEGNEASLRMCRRHGFALIDRRRIVPHELIEYEGEALLLAAPVDWIADQAPARRRPSAAIASINEAPPLWSLEKHP